MPIETWITFHAGVPATLWIIFSFLYFYLIILGMGGLQITIKSKTESEPVFRYFGNFGFKLCMALSAVLTAAIAGFLIIGIHF